MRVVTARKTAAPMSKCGLPPTTFVYSSFQAAVTTAAGSVMGSVAYEKAAAATALTTSANAWSDGTAAVCRG